MAGDRVYRNGYVWTWNGSGWDQGGIPPKKHVLYINRLTGRQYAWNGSLMVEIVNPNSASGGGTTVTIDDSGDYVDLIIADNTPKFTFSTTSIVMSGNTKTATFKVSGAKLTAPILIRTNNAYFTASPSSISPTGGTVAETTVTVTFGGSTNQEDDIVVSSQGASSKTIHAQYTEEQVPTISVEDTPLSFKAAAGATAENIVRLGREPRSSNSCHRRGYECRQVHGVTGKHITVWRICQRNADDYIHAWRWCVRHAYRHTETDHHQRTNQVHHPQRRSGWHTGHQPGF